MIRAGRIDFYSQDFNFDYAGFQINNTTMDSMVIYYPDENLKSLRKKASLKERLRRLSLAEAK